METKSNPQFINTQLIKKRLYQRYPNSIDHDNSKLMEKFQAAGIPDKYISGSWEKVYGYESTQKLLTDMFIEGNGRAGLYIHGQKGVGKSFLAGLIITHLLRYFNIVAYFISSIDLIELTKSNDSRSETKLNNIKNCHLLVLDDLNKEYSTEYTSSKLMGLIEYRSNNFLPIIVTSNFPIDDLEQMKGYEAIADRFRDKEWMLELVLGGESRRGK